MYIKKVKYQCVFLFFLFLLFLESNASATESIIKIETSAPGYGEKALKLAQKNAGEFALVQFMESSSGLQDLNIFDPILQQSDTYIISNTILSYKQEQENTTVRAEVQLDAQKIRQDMASLILSKLTLRPRVLALTGEITLKGNTNTLNRNSIRKDMAPLFQFLTESTWDQIPEENIIPIYTPSELQERINGGDKGAMRIGKENGAEIVLLADITADISKKKVNSNIYQCTASLLVHIVRIEPERFFAPLTTKAIVHSKNPEEGIKFAIQDAANRLKPQLMVCTALAAAQLKNRSGVMLEIRGKLDSKGLDALEKKVRDFVGVKKIEIRLHTSSLTRLQISYTGPIAPFADQLLAIHIGSYTLDIFQAIGRNITADLVKLSSK